VLLMKMMAGRGADGGVGGALWQGPVVEARWLMGRSRYKRFAPMRQASHQRSSCNDGRDG
jgi:hypothetical protein